MEGPTGQTERWTERKGEKQARKRGGGRERRDKEREGGKSESVCV